MSYLRSVGMSVTDNLVSNFILKAEDIVFAEQIGSGTYGDVFKASLRGSGSGVAVAVKKLHMRNLKLDVIEAFSKEASLMIQLQHPNVLAFQGVVTDASSLCIVTEFCPRGSLGDLLLDARQRMDARLRLSVLLQLAQGVAYLHRLNILHRDLKSDNVLLMADWTAKVADFGLTRFVNAKKMTQVGTPMWMAPEIIQGTLYTDKADVYAFGIIVWEVMTREEPYINKEPLQILVEVVNQNLRPTIAARYEGHPLVPVMQDCWQRDAAKRPTFSQLIPRLQAMAADPKLLETFA